jgi:hypothetical protein
MPPTIWVSPTARAQLMCSLAWAIIHLAVGADEDQAERGAVVARERACAQRSAADLLAALGPGRGREASTWVRMASPTPVVQQAPSSGWA